MQAEISKKYNKYQKLVANDPQNSHYMRKMKKYEQQLAQQSGGNDPADLVDQINAMLGSQHNRNIIQSGGKQPIAPVHRDDLMHEFQRGARELESMLDL